MSNLILPKRSVLEKIYPALAASANVTSGLNGAWGNYSQLVSAANMTKEFLACGLYVSWGALISGASLNQGFHMQVQLAKGAAGSEVVIAQRSMAHRIAWTAGTGDTGQMVFGTIRLLRFAPVIVPTGTRLAWRATQVDNTVAHSMSGYVVGYEPNVGFPLERAIQRLDAYRRGMTTVASNSYPSAAETVVTGAGTAFTYGTPVEFIAAAANDMLINSATVNLPAGTPNNLRAFVQVGIGAAGSEEWVAVAAAPSSTTNASYTGDLDFLYPIYVRAGERVAVRVACSSTVTKDVSVVLDVDELR